MGLVLGSLEPLKIAKQCAGELFREGRVPTLVRNGGVWYAWEGGKWVIRDEEWVAFRVVEWGEDGEWVQSEKKTDNGLERVFKRWAPTPQKVGAVVGFLRGVCRREGEKPFWLSEPSKGGGRDVDARGVVATRDKLVLVEECVEWYKEEGTYKWFVMEKGPEWFGLSGAGFDFEPGAKCPVWVKSMREWFPGDKWARECRERFYGDCLRARRRYPVCLVEFGKARGGKGSGDRRLERLVGGYPTFYGTKAHQFVGDFGAEDLSESQVLRISECGELGSKESQKLLTNVKVILGWDSTKENRKGVKEKGGVRYRCAVILQGNDFPRLPDKQLAFLGKVVPVYFRKSWAGRQDLGLEARLEREEKGIFMRLLRAMVRLDAAKDDTERWPIGEHGKAFVERLKASLNPADDFLSRFFVRDTKRFVDGMAIQKARVKYERAMDTVIRRGNGTRVADSRTVEFLIDNTSWPIGRARRGTRGVVGLRLRNEPLTGDVI